MREVLTISKLNRYVKSILHDIPYLTNIEVRGEIINLKRYANAVYFTLKEGDLARISAVTFNISAFPSTLKDGDEVVCRGQVSLYEKGGTYQLICSSVNYYGLGAKLIALSELKIKLEKTGIFDAKHKKPLLKFPQTIGVITPKDSAAQSDIITNITRRYPLVTLKIVNATFQGDNAPTSLINAFKTLNTTAIDVLIIARGGGSSDDLWAFNDENLVLALKERRMPLISAIGHEIDTTLVDYIADVRASTPTAAAELSVPDQNELRQDIVNLEYRLHNTMNIRYETLGTQLEHLISRPVLVNFNAIINNINDMLVTLQTKLQATSRALLSNAVLVNQQLNDRLKQAMNTLYTKQSEEVTYMRATLSSLNPANILKRGYAFISRNEEIITAKSSLQPDDLINITFNDGEVRAVVKGEHDE